MQHTYIKSFGDKILPGIYNMHSKFRSVINFSNGNLLISVVKENIGAGPNNIVYDFKNEDDVTEITISKNDVLLVSRKLTYNQSLVYKSSLDNIKVFVDFLDSNLLILKELLVKYSTGKSLAFLINPNFETNFRYTFDKEFLKRTKYAVTKLREGNISEAISLLSGIGYGLTPSGDDFICGILNGLFTLEYLFDKNLYNLRKSIFLNSQTENLISSTFLYYAFHGCFYKRTKDFLKKFSTSQDFTNEFKNILSIGNTSGIDMLVGFHFCLDNYKIFLNFPQKD